MCKNLKDTHRYVGTALVFLFYLLGTLLNGTRLLSYDCFPNTGIPKDECKELDKSKLSPIIDKAIGCGCPGSTCNGAHQSFNLSVGSGFVTATLIIVNLMKNVK